MRMSRKSIPAECANEGVATPQAVWTDAKLTGPRTQGTLHGYGATHEDNMRAQHRVGFGVIHPPTLISPKHLDHDS